MRRGCLSGDVLNRPPVSDGSLEIVAKGREVGIPTPVNGAVLDVIHEIEAGTRGMDWENFQEIAFFVEKRRFIA